MAQEYVVQYTINVNSQQAQQAIVQFQDATQKMLQLTNRFDRIAQSVGKVNAALASIGKNIPKMDINTTAVETKLRNVISLLHQAKTAASQISQGKMQAVMNTPVTTPKNTKTSRGDLRLLQRTIANTNKAIANLNKQAIVPKANTSNAIKSLDLLLAKINEIKANGKITITASAAGASGAVAGAAAGSGSKSGTGTIKPVPVKRNFPTWRGVTGPIYAGTGTVFAGEMIKGMGVAYALSSVMSGVASVFKDATDYENISQTTKNILGTHDQSLNFERKFDETNKLMRQVGIETKFTAPQVASAGKFLAMAGYNVDDIKNSIRPISDIALVGDTDLGETADVVTNIMTGYEIAPKNMNNAADVLTMTFTKSNTTLMQLAESFKYAGTVAHQSGLDFETAAAAIGVLGDAGIQGSHAGTTLRMMLLNMQNPTKKAKAAWKELGISTKDASGNLRDFNDILADLKKKRDSMSSGDFQTLINQMFRVTAAPGALALIQNSSKVQEVTDLNKYKSTGLAADLADAKKNTIEGLWYQFTSSFTESGMQGFEKMQDSIREFLQKLIAMMKSSEFAAALHDMMSLFLTIMDAIANAFQSIYTIWNKIPTPIKDLLTTFIKIQLYFSVGLGIFKSLYSTGLLLIKPVTAILVPLAKVLVTMRNIAAVGGTMAAMRGVWQAGAVSTLGASVIAGSAGGAASAGAAAGGATAVSQIGLLWGGLKAIGGFLLTNPIGWGITAAGALGYLLAYKIYEIKSRTEEAVAATKAWGESYRNLGVDKLQLTSVDDVIVANMRVMSNEMLDQSKKLEYANELWHRYWIEVEGPQDKKDNTKPFIELPEGESFKTGLERLDLPENTRQLLYELGGSLTRQENLDENGNAYPVWRMNLFDIPFKPLSLDDNGQPILDEKYGLQLLLAQMGAAPTNKTFVNYQNFLNEHLFKAANAQDATNILIEARKQFRPNIRNINGQWFRIVNGQYVGDWGDAEKWESGGVKEGEKMTIGDIESTRSFQIALAQQIDSITWVQKWIDLLSDIDAGKKVDLSRVQEILSLRFAGLFELNNGFFGSESWVNHIKAIYDNPQIIGASTAEEVTMRVNAAFSGILDMYNGVGAAYQKYLSPFLYSTPWSAAMPDNQHLSEGGVSAGTKFGEKRVMDDGKTYTWTSQFNIITQSEYGVWKDSKGNYYQPKDAKKTATWQPVSANGGGGKKDLVSSLHNGADESKYKSHHNSNSAAPKQVIVNIGSLMKIDKQEIDWNNGNQVAVVENIKEQLATALLDVVQDFNANIS